jgi:hypothetical protein
MKLFIIIILIIFLFYNEHFTITNIHQYNYPEVYKNKNCDYNYPEYDKFYHGLTDYEENQIKNCNKYKGFVGEK